jgi:hypothetical protein
MNSKEIRRKNLRALVERTDSGAAFAKQADIAPSLLSQILSQNPTRNIGDRLARKIEDKLGLASGWLDSIHGAPTPSRVEAVPRLSEGDGDRYKALLTLGRLIEDFTPSELAELEAQVELIRRRKGGGF